MKKLFSKRIAAYLIDVTILFIALTILAIFIPTFGDTTKNVEKNNQLVEKYLNKEITSTEFSNLTRDVSYDLSKATFLTTLISIVIYIIYFVIYQGYNNGQTLGKKIFKIKVAKSDGSRLTVNDLIKRALLLYGIAANIVVLILLLFTSKGTYFNVGSIINWIQILFIIVTINMMFFSVEGRGLHDLLGGTTVEEV